MTPGLGGAAACEPIKTATPPYLTAELLNSCFAGVSQKKTPV